VRKVSKDKTREVRGVRFAQAVGERRLEAGIWIENGGIGGRKTWVGEICIASKKKEFPRTKRERNAGVTRDV